MSFKSNKILVEMISTVYSHKKQIIKLFKYSRSRRVCEKIYFEAIENSSFFLEFSTSLFVHGDRIKSKNSLTIDPKTLVE